jgi:hypothetical protein
LKEKGTVEVFSHFTKGDKVLIFALIGVTLSIFFLQRASPTQSGQRRVVVELDNRVVRGFVLGQEAFLQEISIPLPEGDARLEIKRGKVRMLPMKREICPRGICSQMGWIGSPGEMIICMPNKLVVRVEASKRDVDETDMDAITR